MGGLPITQTYILDVPEILIGPVADIKTLRSPLNSIGGIKKATFMTEVAYTEQTFGVDQKVFASIKTSDKLKISVEFGEMSMKNLAYNFGKDGSLYSAGTPVSTTVTTAITTTPQNTLAVTSATGIIVGSTILIRPANSDGTDIIVANVVSLATNTLTLDRTLINIPLNSTVVIADSLALGESFVQQEFALKMVVATSDNKSLIVEVPRVKISSGASLGLDPSSFASSTLEFQAYNVTRNDPNFSYFNGGYSRITMVR